MKSYAPFGFPMGKQDNYEKQLAADAIRLRGTERAPHPPRDVMAQPGSRKALITWKVPDEVRDITQWQVAKDTEFNVVYTSADATVRQYELALSASASPAKYNVFVRSLNALGVPSRWIRTVASAASEGAGAPPPPEPTPPPGYTQEAAGGGEERIPPTKIPGGDNRDL